MDFSSWGLVMTVVIAHLIALLSPGPDFILVIKSGVRNTARNALGVAVGIATANAVYIVLCLIGVGALLAQSIVLMTAIKMLGGLFLLYVAWHALKSRRSDYAFINQPLEHGAASSFCKEFCTGFLSGILNPKNPIFYLSVFSLVLTEGVGLWLKVGLATWMTLVVFAWDAFIILVLAQQRVKRLFARLAFYIDKLAASILGFVGLRLVQAALLEDR